MFGKIILIVVIIFISSAVVYADLNIKWIGDLQIEPENPLPGDTVRFHAKFIVTGGDIPELNLHASLDDELIFSGDFKDLKDKQEVEVVFEWKAIGGPHSVAIIIDPEDDIQEDIESDNTIAKSFDVRGGISFYDPSYLDELTNKSGTDRPANPPDLTALISVETDRPGKSEAIVFSAIISNKGESDSVESILRFEISSRNGQIILVKDFTIPAILKDDSYAISFSYILDKAGDYVIWAQADTDNKIYEKNENNNIAARNFSVK